MPRSAASASGGSSTTSAPAATAIAAAFSFPNRRLIACIDIESVNTSPSKPSSVRSRPVRMGRLSVAGSPSVGSSAGRRMCVDMTASIPAAIVASKGTSSTASRRERGCSITARSRWVSVAVSPWPGKCLAVESIPPAWIPLMVATAIRPTNAGSSPKERTLMIGFVGLLLTSTTG